MTLLFSGGFNDLTRLLPDRVHLEGIAYLDPAELAWTQGSDLSALIAALRRAGVDLQHASDNNTRLIAAATLPAYARSVANLPAGHPVERYVDWDAWTARIRDTLTPVLVMAGTFSGTWYIHP